MFKRLLVVGSILLLLGVGFLLVPAHVAHADSCNGSCGQDPVAAGCVPGQFVLAGSNFTTNGGSTWQIRLRGSTGCPGKVWASLVLVRGSNGISNANSIKVRSLSNNVANFDILYAGTFYDGAYTNMIDDVGSSCASYSGAYVTPARPSTC